MTKKILLISVKPEFANKIISGEKTIELRKAYPNASNGDIIIIYSTSPIKAIVGIGKIKNIYKEPPGIIWKKYKSKIGIDKKRFNEYYLNFKKAVGIEISEMNQLENEIKLEDLRNFSPKFSPPQTFKYMTSDDLDSWGLSVDI